MAFSLEFFFLLARGDLPADVLRVLARRRVLDLCDRCRLEHAISGQEEPALSPDPAPTTELGGEHEPHLFSLTGLTRRTRRLSRLRELRRQAKSECRELLSLGLEGGIETIRRSLTRYRSRYLVELLLTECRRRVRTAPEEARKIAALAEEVISAAAGRERRPWHGPLSLLATAHRANAVRVAGDLRAAAHLFREIRAAVREDPIPDPRIKAQLASLEASLHIDQRSFALASEVLAEACSLFRQIGDRLGEARILVQQANLSQTEGRPQDTLTSMERAAVLLKPGQSAYLYLCTVNGRLNALLDLDRFGEAAALLSENSHLYLEDGEPALTATLRVLEGRIALGLNRPDEAERRILEAQEEFLHLGRSYDAALAALYRIEICARAGRTTEIEQLARQLLETFRARGVEREALATLFLLSEAATARAVTLELLQSLRSRLEAAASSKPPLASA